MKAKRKNLIILAVIGMLLLFWKPLYTVGAFLLLPSPETCTLCDQESREVPCLLNRNTGDVGPLVGTAVPGKFQFVGCLGAMGGWDSDTQTAQVTVPNSQDGLALPLFCRSCRFYIADGSGNTFVLLDLTDPEQPVIYPLEKDALYTMQGWTIRVQGSQTEDSFEVAVSSSP